MHRIDFMRSLQIGVSGYPAGARVLNQGVREERRSMPPSIFKSVAASVKIFCGV
jgi:hypothetical protein